MFNQIYNYLFDSITSDSVNNYTNFYYLTLIRKDENSPWSIHGLWPQTSLNSYPTFCRNVDFDVSKIEPIISKLNEYWYSDEEPKYHCDRIKYQNTIQKRDSPKSLEYVSGNQVTQKEYGSSVSASGRKTKSSNLFHPEKEEEKHNDNRKTNKYPTRQCGAYGDDCGHPKKINGHKDDVYCEVAIDRSCVEYFRELVDHALEIE